MRRFASKTPQTVASLRFELGLADEGPTMEMMKIYEEYLYMFPNYHAGSFPIVSYQILLSVTEFTISARIHSHQ